MPDVDGRHTHVFESLQLAGLYVGGLLYLVFLLSNLPFQSPCHTFVIAVFLKCLNTTRIMSISDWCRMPFIILHSLFVLNFWPLSSSHPTFLAFKLSVFSRRTLLCLQVLDVFPYFLERVTQYGSWTQQGLTEILPSLQNPFWLPGKTRVFLWAGFLVVAHLCCSPDDSILNSSSACFPLSSLWARRTASLTVDLCISSAWL